MGRRAPDGDGEVMTDGAAEPQGARGASLLMEHVEAFEGGIRPSANERLERILGGYLTQLLVGALSGTRSARAGD
jgi:hypothetical protein